MMKLVHNEFIKNRYFYLVTLWLALLMILTLPASMSGADGREYLRWTHSLVFDLDLHLLNNLEAVGGSYKLTPTGYVFDRVNIGAPLMWSPFFVLASLFLPEPPDGELPAADSTIYLVWLNFSSWLYPILGGLLTIGALRRFFTPTVLAQTGIAILFGTPVLFYMMIFPMSAHPALIFLSSLLLYLWLSNHPTGQMDDQLDRQLSSKLPGFLSHLTIGIVIGWMMLVASYNVVFFLLPGFDLLKDLVGTKNWQGVLQKGVAVGMGGLIGFLPQMIVWWLMFGSPFYSPYSGQLFWSEPYLLPTLFSTFHGLFFFAPVLLLVIPGLWWWRRNNAWVVLSIGTAWLALTYIVSINVAWWAGASFGNRYLLVLTPFFAFGLAAFLQKGKVWAAVLVGMGVLWTVGLYLEFLNGVGFTSDSNVYSALTLAAGQLEAWRDIPSILPRLMVNRPWHLVSWTVLPILIFGLVFVSRFFYGFVIVKHNKAVKPVSQLGILSLGLGVVLFIGIAGLRGEQAKAALTAQGFYDQPHQVIRREVKEMAGKAGLVTRALYHRQTNQPEKAIADLKLASELWKSDETETPSRLYLGPSVPLPDISPDLSLDYPGQVRLVGYRITEANPQLITGELFWKKVDGSNSKIATTPIVRAYDRFGGLVGRTEVEFPFPAEYIPAGDYFKDTFQLQFDRSPESWVWLGVILAEDFALPVNIQGKTDTGIIASVNVDQFPMTLLPATEFSAPLAVKPAFLAENDYQPGQLVPVQLVSQATNTGAENASLEFDLVNSAGQSMAHEQYSFTLAGRPAASTYCFALPPTLTVDDYQLVIKLVPVNAGILLNNDNQPVRDYAVPIQISADTSMSQDSTSICQMLRANFSRRYEPSTPQHPLEVMFGSQIRLAGFDLSLIPKADSVLARVVLHWNIQENVTDNYMVAIQLLNAAGQAVIDHAGIPVHQTRPTLTWLREEWILDEYILEVPPLSAGDYQLTLSLVDEQTGRPIPSNSGKFFVVLESLQIP